MGGFWTGSMPFGTALSLGIKGLEALREEEGWQTPKNRFFFEKNLQLYE